MLFLLSGLCCVMFVRGIFYGVVFDFDTTDLEMCMREEPDMKLLYDVNQRYFIWNLFQFTVLNLYILIGWRMMSSAYKTVDNYKESADTSYTKLQIVSTESKEDIDAILRSRSNYAIDHARNEEMNTWKYFE